MDFAVKIICDSDLTDLRYLYKFGEYITENEIGMANFLNTLPEEKIQAMARTFTEGYREGFVLGGKDITKKKTVNIRFQLGFERIVKEEIRQFAEMGLQPVIYRSAVHSVNEGYREGFVLGGKDITKKKTVNIRFQLGFERIVKEEIRQFAEMGLQPVVYRSAVHSVNKKQHHRIGYYGAVPNQQFEYDHKDDAALYLDHEFVQRKLRVLQVAYEQVKEMAAVHGGPACMETFGETPFVPKKTKEACVLTPHQQKLQVSYDNESGQIVNRYIKGEERSFTIIAYPVKEIGEKFEEIFEETVKLNTLDNELYRKIQQSIIDALDKGTCVHILGKGENETDLTVALHTLENPDKQTNFENCVADVNIPVGEVFTSPMLKGTNGTLAVSRVFLNGLEYRGDKQTNFENCVADVNIPVGEVFTSPMLKGTNGTLAVSRVFLNGLEYRGLIPVGEVFTSPMLKGTNGTLAVSRVFLNGLEYRGLKLLFKDGKIAEYTCKNFETEDENKSFLKENLLHHHETLPLGEFAIGTNTTAYVMAQKYNIAHLLPILIANKSFLKENLLHHHETLPLGEFAIGTNTTAYVMAQKYNIAHLLPILIAEKMGPHFAVGDHHETLPLGEFAIGTNTTAYVMAQKYNIAHLLPILIAEKMGPHFAVGDTCYSWSEDTAVYNPATLCGGRYLL